MLWRPRPTNHGQRTNAAQEVTSTTASCPARAHRERQGRCPGQLAKAATASVSSASKRKWHSAKPSVGASRPRDSCDPHNQTGRPEPADSPRHCDTNSDAPIPVAERCAYARPGVLDPATRVDLGAAIDHMHQRDTGPGATGRPGKRSRRRRDRLRRQAAALGQSRWKRVIGYERPALAVRRASRP